MASFDENGLTIDRLADIKTQIQDELKEGFGSGIDLDERSPFGVIIGIVSERYSLIWEILEAVNDASYPDDSFGVQLDKLLAFNGIVREQATASVVDLTFEREPASSGDVTIPIGTQVHATSSTVLWATDVEATIPSAGDFATVQATADQTGPTGALAGTLIEMVSTPSNVLSVVNPADASLGSEQESDSEVKARRRLQLGRVGTATASGIRSALNLLEEIRVAQLVVNDTDFAVGSQPPHSIAAYIATETTVNLEQDSELFFDAVLVTGNSCAIELNGSPIAITPVPFTTSNAQTLVDIAAALQGEAEIDTAISDGVDSIQVDGTSGAALPITIVITGGASQPVVTQTFNGPVLDTIAQSLWDSKGAGIQTHGELSGTAIDDEGEIHILEFSQIEELVTHVELTLSVDSDYDLTASELAIRTSIVDYATNSLLPGVDVLSFKILCAASDVGSAGIRTLASGVSASGAGPFIDEIAVDVSQFATIDSADIDFVYV